MNINPKSGSQYTLSDLEIWFSEAQQKGEVLEIFPCNPEDVPFLWSKATIKTRDDIATLTQWLGGIPL